MLFVGVDHGRNRWKNFLEKINFWNRQNPRTLIVDKFLVFIFPYNIWKHLRKHLFFEKSLIATGEIRTKKNDKY